MLLVVGLEVSLLAFVGELLVFRNRARVDAVLARLGEHRRRARAGLKRRRRGGRQRQRRYSRLTARPESLGDVVAPALEPALAPPLRLPGEAADPRRRGRDR
ncbi:uncharacterized protein LOC127752286 [Frankliniella occidentalis]|uniref:Uncharacterized protein LOC127752286 n=1 Tax=Frankliniella occidentalis TaxID=133901 RepID=A0A9C6XWA3_FRAOC|nr:uncharacterized protein LOC127752286 [Frankliniella occidentalis]